MKFIARKKRKGFLDYLRPRKSVVVTYRRTLGKVLGFGGGYSSNVKADESLTESGDVKRIVERLASEAREQGMDVPLAFPHGNISGYEIVARGWDWEFERVERHEKEYARKKAEEARARMPKFEFDPDYYQSVLKNFEKEFKKEFWERQRKYFDSIDVTVPKPSATTGTIDWDDIRSIQNDDNPVLDLLKKRDGTWG